MGTISGCLDLKMNLKAKMFLYVNYASQRCPNKIIKTFMIQDFLHLPPVANLKLRISPRIFEKIRNDPSGILRSLGETDT
jgi:hypothetical protein